MARLITKDLETFAEGHWTAHKKPADIISRSDKSKPETALFNSSLPMFDFDEVIEGLFGRGQCKSADAFCAGLADAFGDKEAILDKLPKKERKQTALYLIEFKNYDPKPQEQRKPATRCKYLKRKGFPAQVCPKDAFKMAFYQELERMDATECPIVKKRTGNSVVCDKCSLLKEQRDRRDKELTDSILLKAIESYTVLARTVFTRPDCADAAPRKLLYCVVIGRPCTAETTERLNVFRRDIESDHTESNATLEKLKNALSRLARDISALKEPYLYDDIRVVTPRRFEIQANQINVKKGT